MEIEKNLIGTPKSEEAAFTAELFFSIISTEVILSSMASARVCSFGVRNPLIDLRFSLNFAFKASEIDPTELQSKLNK